MTYRILVTGSRDWPDGIEVVMAVRREIIRSRHLPLRKGEAPGFVVVHGGCPTGVDAAIHAHCIVEGFPVEKYPGKDFPSFKARNQHMVDLGANVCLAFATKWASGTGQTARMARRAGIHTTDFGVDTA